jgi:cytochrome P450
MMRWSYIAQLDNFHNYSFTDLGDSPEIHAQADAAKLEMKQYIAHLIPERLQQLKENPQLDDILSRILRTPFPPSVGFGMERVGVNVVGFLVGAVETPSQAVAQALDELLKRPIHLAGAKQAAEKGDDELFSGYVWEAMRFHPSSPIWPGSQARTTPWPRGRPARPPSPPARSSCHSLGRQCSTLTSSCIPTSFSRDGLTTAACILGMACTAAWVNTLPW